jgi:FkbM family methyltransferase
MINQFLTTIKQRFPQDTNFTIFDIGSRDLNESIIFKKEFPNALVVAFEPNPHQYRECAAKAMWNDILFLPYAISDKDGFVEFLPIDMEKSPIKNVGASSILPITELYYQRETLVQSKPISVKSLRVDTFCANNSFNKVDCAWIDVQGMAMEVLEGFGPLLDKLQVLHVELEYVEMYKGEKLYPEVNDFLLGKGFKNIYTPIRNSRDYFDDFLYVRD